MNDYVFLSNHSVAWATAAAITLVTLLLIWVVKRVVITRLAPIAERSAIKTDDSIVAAVRKTRIWLLILPAVVLSSQGLVLPPRARTLLAAAATLSFFIQLGLWTSAILDFWINRSQERALKENPAFATSLAAMTFVARVILWAIILMLVLDNLGVNITALVTGLGVGGIAIALAVQNILGDLFASMSIIIDKPFVLGDSIVVDEFSGTVEHVGLKTTRIRSVGGEQIVFSNSDLLKSRIRNFKRMHQRRIVFGFGVLYQTTAEQLARVPVIVREIVEAQPNVRFDRAHFKSLGASSYDFEVVYVMLDPDYNKYMDTQQRINLALVRTFAAERIGFAFPSQSLYMETPLRLRRDAAAEQPAPATTTRP
jgi:small-conductance mechanosensitive channel